MDRSPLTSSSSLDPASVAPYYGERYGFALCLRSKDRGILGKYATIVLSILMVMVYLHLPSYAYARNSAFVPVYIFAGFVMLVMPVISLKPNAFIKYLTTPFAIWIGVFVFINLVHLLNITATDGNLIRSIAIERRIKELLLVLIVGFAFSAGLSFKHERVFLVLCLVIPCSVILDFLKPGLFYEPGMSGTVLGRAGGTFLSSNSAGEALLLVFVLACPLLRKKHRTPVFMLTGLAALFTYSRATILAWIVVGAYFSFKRVLPRTGSALLLVAAGVGAMMFSEFESYLNNRNDLYGAVENLHERLRFFQRMEAVDDSAVARTEMLRAAWNLFLENPFFGAGAGHTLIWEASTESTHNTPLLLAAEYGLVGLTLWFAMIVMLWRGNYFNDRRLQIAVAFLFAFFCMFSHNVLEKHYWLFTLLLVSGSRMPSKDYVWARTY